jgi:hypothetical protein
MQFFVGFFLAVYYEDVLPVLVRMVQPAILQSSLDLFHTPPVRLARKSIQSHLKFPPVGNS